jgi:hypothetical protein
MDNVGWTTTNDCVVLVLTGCRVTFRAAFFKTIHFFKPEVPAARALAQVSTDCAKIALSEAQPLDKNAYKVPLTQTLVRRALTKTTEI